MKDSCVDMVSNKDVLNRANQKSTIWNNIRKIRDRMIAHILSHGDFAQLIVKTTTKRRGAT